MSENLESNVGLISQLLNNPEFRDAFIFEHIKNGVAFQMNAMRDERGWTQAKLGQEAKKPRSVITRLEDPNYGQFSIQTLREIAAAFRVGLLVKFVPFSRLVQEYDDVSPAALAAQSIDDPKEVRRLKRWAAFKDRLEAASIEETAPPTLLRLVGVSLPVEPDQLGLSFGSASVGLARNTGASSTTSSQTMQSNVRRKVRAMPQRRRIRKALSERHADTSWAKLTARSAA